MLEERPSSIDLAHDLPGVDLSPRRGRPRAAEASIEISVRIPVSLYDAYCRASLHTRVPARSIMRDVLSRSAVISSPLRRRR